MEYYAAERKMQLLPFATAWVELESIMLSEISQVAKRHTPCDLTYKRKLMNNNKKSEQNRSGDIETKNRLTVCQFDKLRSGEGITGKKGKGLVKEHV